MLGNAQAPEYDVQPTTNRHHPYCTPVAPMRTTNTHTVTAILVLEAGTWELLRVIRSVIRCPLAMWSHKRSWELAGLGLWGNDISPLSCGGSIFEAASLDAANHP